MKKLILALSFIAMLLIIPSSYADTLKFNDWVYDSDLIIIDDQTFKFKISESSSSLFVNFNNKNRIIKLNECDDDKTIKICLKNWSNDEGFIGKSGKVEIYFFQPNISISRTSNYEVVNVGDKITFDVIVKNVGDLDAKNVEYTDYFPKEILIDKVSGDCLKNEDNIISYESDLNINQAFTCHYTVIPVKETDLKLKAQIEYDDIYGENKVYSNITKIKSNPLYTVVAYNEDKTWVFANESVKDWDNATLTLKTTLLKDIKVQVGEKFNIYLNFTNLIDEDIAFENLTIMLPKEMIVEKSTMQLINDNYVFKGILKKNSTLTFFYSLIPTQSGNFEITYAPTIIKNKKNLGSTIEKKEFSITSGEIDIESNLDDVSTFDATKEMFLMFYLKNKYNYTSINSGNINITSDLFPSIFIPINKIGPNEAKELYKISLKPQNITSIVTKKISLQFDYITEYGSKKTFQKKYSLTIKPIKDIEIIKTFSSKKVEEGDDVTVVVSIKNTRSKPIYTVTIQELLPTDLSRAGKTKAIIDTIPSGDTVIAYEYTIKAPKVKNVSVIQTRSNLSYYDDSSNEELKKDFINFIEQFNITVTPKKIVISVKKSLDYSSIDLGENARITYVVENKDIETAYNLRFAFSQSRDVDVLNDYEYTIDRLDPGEVMTFRRETIKPKLSGKISSGKSYLTFNDADNNLFESTLDSLTLTVSNRSTFGPYIFLTKSASKNQITEGDDLNISLTLQNLGDEDINLNIYNENKDFFEYINAKSLKNITYKVRPLRGENLSKAFAYYTYQNNEYRVFADTPSLTITSKPIEEGALKNNNINTSSVDDEKIIEELLKNNKNESLDESLSSNKGFFIKIWLKMKSYAGFG